MQGNMMGYGHIRGGGGINRHHHPQPQRQNRRNNRFRGTGRFDNRGVNQQRSNKEIKTEPSPNEVPKPNNIPEQKPIATTTTTPQQQPPKPLQQQQQQPKPLQQQQQQPQQKPPQQQPKPLQQQQQPQKPPQQQQQQQQKPPQQQQQQQSMFGKPKITPINNKPQNNQNNISQNLPAAANQQKKMDNDMKNLPKNMSASNASINNMGSQQNLNMNKNQNAANQMGNRGNIRRHQGTDKSGPGGGGGGGGGREEHFITSKLKEISGPTIDLPPMEQTEQKFSGRNRLYIGNLTNDVTEQEILDIFNSYGETAELFLNKDKNFAFIRIDYKANADKAKREVDGRMRRGRPLRVRFAPHNAAIKVKNLTPFISNELLFRAFEIFGKIERAIVKVDDRGKSLGEGIVEFTRKAGAMAAIRHCTERCFFLTSSLKPVVVESFDEVDEVDGYTEKTLPRKNQDYMRARELGPRFAEPGSFEHEYGTRWKQLYELYKQKEEALRREMNMEEEKLEAQMEYAKYEHETELLREQLRQREQDRERQKRSWEMTERNVDEQREKERETILRQQEDMAQRMRLQEDELRRRQQENTLFMQAQQLNRILDVQEQSIGGGRGYESPIQDKRGFDGPMSNMGGPMPMDMSFMDHYDQMCGHMGYEDGMGRWDSRQEDYSNKRRRY